jgi:hypothetical protein
MGDLEGEEMERREREGVAGVCIHRLADTNDEPEPEHIDMRACEEAPTDGGDHIGEEVLDRMRELRGDADVGLEGVVLLVDVFVDGGMVEGTVGPIEQCVIHEHGNQEIPNNDLDWWPSWCEGHSHGEERWVCQIDQEGRDDEVTEECVFETLHDQIRGGKLFLDSVLKEVILVIADKQEQIQDPEGNGVSTPCTKSEV